jgi:malate dehydrogenase (oxaloacetate-decarboxylating)
MNPVKEEMAAITNPANETGDLASVMKGADVFLGVSAKERRLAGYGSLDGEGSILFAIANPDPEILPDAAYAAGCGRRGQRAAAISRTSE